MALLALGGAGGSWLVAADTAHSHAHSSQQSFAADAAQVDANMDLEVEHETDLLVGAAAFIKEHPDGGPAAFQRWTDEVHAVKRYPELIALAEMHAAPDLTGCPETSFVGPGWIRRFSSVASLAICKGTNSLSLARDNDAQQIYGVDMLGMRFLGEDVPVYRTSSTPTTPDGRERAFLGAAAIALYPQVLLHDALSGFPRMGIEVTTTYRTRLAFSAGYRSHDTSLTLPLANGLSETIFGTVQGGSVFDDKTASLIFLAGTALSLLLAVALFLLGTGRARAMLLVSEKTGELEFQALHDGLTGLPNRNLVMDRIGHALARSARASRPLAVLFIDFDGFKTVNDTFGHGAGDQLLRTVAKRLSEMIRDADTVGRLGGDEFVVLLEPGDARPSPEIVAERVLELLNLPIELGAGVEVRLTASIGIAARPAGDGRGAAARRRPGALLAPRSPARTATWSSRTPCRPPLAERHALESTSSERLENRELYLVYQPTFRLADRTLGGVEALLRWQHPTRGLIAPDTFIPIAEDSGLILEIGRWVATEACRQAAAWRDRGLDLTMAINVSGRQIDEIDFADKISGILARTGLTPPPSRSRSPRPR